MKWLLYGNLTPAVAEALRQRKHEPHDLAELQLPPDASPLDILKAAHKQQWEILTNDPAIASAPFDADFYFNGVIVYLQLEGGDVEQDDAIVRLFTRYKRLTIRRLYTVTAARVKIRQLPHAP